MAVSFAFPSSLQFDSEYQQTCLETSHLRDSRLFHLILPLKQVCNIEAPGALREALNASANKFAFTIGGKIDCISLGGWPPQFNGTRAMGVAILCFLISAASSPPPQNLREDMKDPHWAAPASPPCALFSKLSLIMRSGGHCKDESHEYVPHSLKGIAGCGHPTRPLA
ncbi:predicted protein [Histoplasma capsulatum var. duboisii H88]|uniref:Predicted protein n=1 Tax=Ajellomyces capsulatus (strain H88) TaxID=544711 RepID=F0UUP5_AJEC8|nr:predicted protein [Histoplasma capsulatum var. duboisii H88]